MIIYLSLLVAIIGLIMFFAAKNNPDVKQVGYVMFWTGLLAFLINAATIKHILP